MFCEEVKLETWSVWTWSRTSIEICCVSSSGEMGISAACVGFVFWEIWSGSEKNLCHGIGPMLGLDDDRMDPRCREFRSRNHGCLELGYC